MIKANDNIKAVRVQWRISADIECPHCSHDNDFMEVDEFYHYSQPGENVEKFYSEVEFTCRSCKKDFIVDGADY